MNGFFDSILQIFKRAYAGILTNTGAITFAFGFAVVTLVRIQLDWPEQEAYNFLFNCLHWSFALGAILSLAAITAARSLYDTPKAQLLANLISAISVILAFISLYFWGSTNMTDPYVRYQVLTHLAVARMSVALLITIIGFILFSAQKKEHTGFARALFMTQKAFFIAAIYGLVMMGGGSAVAGAIQNLLYPEMSEKVYMTIATLSGFMAFTIFVGYFPSFKKGHEDPRRSVIEKQPQFIEVLFGFILIPLFLALSTVLLMWAAKTVTTRTWPVFTELASIATAYALGGIWLHMMVTEHKGALARFFKSAYPLAALIILAFEAQALWYQLVRFGMKTVEYEFILMWLIAVSSAVLLLIYKRRAHVMIALIICAIGVFSVLPVVGFQPLPVMAQVNRLENLLVASGNLVGGKLEAVAADRTPAEDKRVAITDAVEFLAYAQNAKLPQWFEPKLAEGEVFKNKLGFDKTWSKDPRDKHNSGYLGLSLMLPSQAVNISDYQWMVPIGEQYRGYGESINLETPKGIYKFYWKNENFSSGPSLKVVKGPDVIFEESLNPFIDQLMSRYPLSQDMYPRGTTEDLTVSFDGEKLAMLLVFNTININVDPQNDSINYYLNLNAIYVREKP